MNNRLEIEYCNQCGFMLRAAWLAQELLRAFDEELERVCLVPGGGGNLIIRLNQDVLFDRRASGRFPEAKELKCLVRDRIHSDKRFGHTEHLSD